MVLGLEDGHLALSPLPGASMGGVRVPMGKVPVWVLQQVRRMWESALPIALLLPIITFYFVSVPRTSFRLTTAA